MPRSCRSTDHRVAGLFDANCLPPVSRAEASVAPDDDRDGVRPHGHPAGVAAGADVGFERRCLGLGVRCRNEVTEDQVGHAGR